MTYKKPTEEFVSDDTSNNDIDSSNPSNTQGSVSQTPQDNQPQAAANNASVPSQTPAPADNASADIPDDRLQGDPNLQSISPGQGLAPLTKDNSSQGTNPNPQQTAASMPSMPLPPTAQEYNAHDLQLMQDLSTGQIKPETYNSLYGKKDTLGKIGTIFGLLLGGIGSGITGQPNALLGMMDKEIERDLQAQQKNVGNAQNFLNLAYNHEVQQAQVKHSAYENALTAAQTGKIPAETQQLLSQSNALNAQNAGLAQMNRAKNLGLAGALNHLYNINGGNPQGQQLLDNQITPAVMQQMQQNNQNAADAQNLHTINYMKQQQQQQPGQANVPKFDSGVDYKRMQNLIGIGKNAPETPGAIPPQDVPQLQSEAKDVATNRAIMHIWNDSFNELNNSITANKFNPQRRAALIDAIATRISKDTGAMSTEQASKILDGMFPTASDRLYPGNIQAKYQKGVDHFAGMEAATPALDRYGLKTQFPTMQIPSRKKKASANSSNMSASQGAVERTTQDGRTALFDPQTKQFLGYKGENGIAGQ